MTLHELRTWLATLADAQATVPARVVLERLPTGEGAEPALPLADLAVEQVADMLARSSSTVREYARAGLLPGAYRQRGREWRVPREAIGAFQRAEAGRKVAPAAPKKPRPVCGGDQEVNLGAWRQVRTS